MVGVVQMHLQLLRVRVCQQAHARLGNEAVAPAKMRQHRAMRLAPSFQRGGHASAVVAHRRRQALQLAGCLPRQQAAPAKPDDAHPATAVFCSPGDSSLQVGPHAHAAQLPHGTFERLALLHVGIAIAQLHARLHARKRGGCHRQVTGCGIALGHVADVRIHAKNLLQHHHGAARRPGWPHHPGRADKAIHRRQIHPVTHGHAP